MKKRRNYDEWLVKQLAKNLDTDDVIDAVFDTRRKKRHDVGQDEGEDEDFTGGRTLFTLPPGDARPSPRALMECPKGDYTTWASGQGERCPRHHILLVEAN